MSGSSEATAAMSNREPFSMSSPSPVMNPVASQPQLDQQMHMSYMNSDGGGAFRQVGSSPPPFQSVPAGATVISHSTSDQKRKRGRPRKYGPDGSMNVPLGSPQPPINAAMPQHQQQQNFSPPPVAAAVAPLSTQLESLPSMDGSGSPMAKKARGRPRGSRNKVKQHSEALGSTGIGFVPHILNVNAGEDIASKIMAICQNGPRAVCVLSANGAISMVTLRQQATSGGTATYEGRWDILSLSGSFMLTEVAGQKSRTGGLSVALAQPDGTVMGGCVAGLLVAASPAQVIVGSFMPDGQREVLTNYVEPSSAPRVNQGGGAGASSSPSRGTLSESSGGPASPLNLSSGAYNITQGMSGIPWK
ncbi:AT-hook motif nuclear-localized protein 10-like [Salvia miltiorrhiza]|uniref:AT-hook motif nuclear-localized protein 10-like n=1 Tax=Salvia miltiorrhiza TaxID=226208 RepID=UPI0025ABB7E6|nr:AT-hook motif nuclear-localized protein 10-like [Salvia miltiorrhiza]XP_057794724.1 AT-hook motif nuclear-localized protein 10-like [Salvia miltiorrhiza]